MNSTTPLQESHENRGRPGRAGMAGGAWRVSGWALAMLCAVPLWAGCAGLTQRMAIVGPSYEPGNVYLGGEKLPRSLKRVAVLPVTARGVDPELGGSRATLEQVLQTELGKHARFEVVPVMPDNLRQWTGRSQWATTDRFPTNFFDRLREGTGCDAVLFAQVTDFRAYPPLAVGWRLQLLDCDGLQVWWAVDEHFDASEPAVANAARRYHLEHAGKPAELTDTGEILYSPRRFGSYAANAVVATCPGH
ncbi:MAG: hypothetical protein JNK85_15235 [Verrucomicrobiales bacterium]|nr:hypothetical protein [Verrucomicrobiales bacterium]